MMTFLFKLCRVCLLALPIWLLLRRPWKHRPLAREWVMGGFALFMAGLLSLVLEGEWAAPGVMWSRAVQRLQTGESINLLPLRTLRAQVAALPSENSLVMLLGNTLLFMPWGFCLPWLWPRFRHPWAMVGMALLLTCAIETAQLFIGRMTDVDDVLLNFCGSVMGSGMWVMFRRKGRFCIDFSDV